MPTFTPQPTADGSYTFFSAEFNEAFHSNFGAKQEAEFKFVEPLQLRQKAQQPQLYLLDICYGLGYNTAAALTAIWQINPNCQIHCIGLELDSTVPQTAIAYNLLNSYPDPIPDYLTTLATTYQLQTDKIQAQLLIGDARQTLQQVHHSGFQADAVFLDPFSPPTCPQLWTVEFLTLLAHCLTPSGHLATYVCSAAARTALMAAGLNISSTTPVGRRTPGTVASFSAVGLPPLSQQEQEHLQTRAAVPYRDPNLSDSKEVILQRRQQEQQLSRLEPTSQWKKRWFLKQQTQNCT
jgi:tRNA U34 5-methylaminomethyl-2-thiouridine-forming methyltransferase MnmC